MSLLHSYILVSFIFLTLYSKVTADHWAVLVAGSNGWYNYRHQADIYHAYHVLLNHGVPASNIITFAYDDIAHNDENPFPGVVKNHPNGSNVYQGFVGDYTKDDVTVQNFLNVITGQAVGTKKVLKSGPNDHVFIFLSDHGAPGLFAFPSESLYATDLINAIAKMREKKMYKQMVIYLEACESGSMFNNLLAADIFVFATTASSPDESSYACYWDDKMQVFLGDVYSVNWMENSDKVDLGVESLWNQYLIVKNETNTSKVMQYGDKTFDKEPIGEFQGNSPDQVALAAVRATLGSRSPPLDAVRSENVRVVTLQRRINAAMLANAKSSTINALRKELDDILQARERVDQTFFEVLRRVSGSVFEAQRIMEHVDNSQILFDCYDPLVNVVTESCFFLPQDEWAAYRMHTMVTLCKEGYQSEEIANTFRAVCGSMPSANHDIRSLGNGGPSLRFRHGHLL